MLPQFSFHSEDVILLGNEYDGLPAHIIEECDSTMYIPLPQAVLYKPQSFSPIDPVRSRSVAQNGIPNLNVAMTASIISYNMYLQQHQPA
ncbi:MAG: hypothetical protein KGJ21_00025 [Pseudomonadota bacterium]|nr:hypothetical protein [Pseudomonadota bacterium]